MKQIVLESNFKILSKQTVLSHCSSVYCWATYRRCVEYDIEEKSK